MRILFSTCRRALSSKCSLALSLCVAGILLSGATAKPPDQIITGVAAGSRHTVLLKGDGSVWHCGLGEYHYIGDGIEFEHDTPVPMGSGFIKIAAGPTFSLGLKADGTLWGWGDNDQGGLWNAPNFREFTPVQFGEGYDDVYVSGGMTIAHKADGSLWTRIFELPQELGGPDFKRDGYASSVIFKIGRIKSDYKKVVFGQGFWLALKPDGSLWAKGVNDNGQLGDGTNIERATPVQVGSDIVDVAAGDFHALALKSDGSVWAWGYNYQGSAGDGTHVDRNTPAMVGKGFRAIAASGSHSAALKEDGSLWWWGQPWLCQGENCTGIAQQHGSPSMVDVTKPNLESRAILSFALGGEHTVAVKRDGSLYVSGANNHGQWCNGTQRGERVIMVQ